MKLRHAAAFALMGWYLVIPPDGGTGRPDEDAPLRTWKIQYSFDTANECEAAKYKLSQQSIRDLKAIAPKHKDLDLLFIANICIASDDPRLKGN